MTLLIECVAAGAQATVSAFDSAESQGCQHWGLSSLQLQQEKKARRIRKCVLFEGSDMLQKLVKTVREELGEESVSVCVRLGNSNGKCSLHMAAWRGDDILVAELLVSHLSHTTSVARVVCACFGYILPRRC